MADDEVCLHWKDHQLILFSYIGEILENKYLADCTIVAEGQHLQAHRLILSACSSYFQSLLCQPLDKHPMILLKDVKFDILQLLMEFMYKGEVTVTQNNFNTFEKAAKSLKIKGLLDNENPVQTRVENPPLMPPTATTSSQLRTQPRQKIQPESSTISISSNSSGSTIWESTLPPTMGKRRHISPEMDYNSDSSSYTTSSPTMGKRRRIPKMPSEYDLAFPNNDNTFDNSKGFQSTPLVTTNKVPTSPIAAAQMNVTNTTPLPTSPKFSILISDVHSVNRQISLFADSGSTSLAPETSLLEVKVEPINSDTESDHCEQNDTESDHCEQNDTESDNCEQNDTESDNCEQNDTESDNCEQNDTESDNCEQNDTESDNCEQNDTESDNCEQNDTESDNCEQNDTESDNCEQNDTESDHCEQNDTESDSVMIPETESEDKDYIEDLTQDDDDDEMLQL